MNLQQAESLWSDQLVPQRGEHEIAQVVAEDVARTRRQLRWSVFFTIACLLGGIANFYGQFIANGDPLLVSLLRFSVVLMVIPFQVHAWWSLRRRYQERVKSQLDQQSWLATMVADLKRESQRPPYMAMACYAVVVLGLVVATKWLDYVQGTDTLAECVAIVGVVVALFVLAFAGVWHRQNTFLRPRLAHYQRLLEDG